MDPLLLLPVLVFGAVVLAFVGVRGALTREGDAVLERVSRYVQARPQVEGDLGGGGSSRWARLLRPFAFVSKPKDGSAELSRITRKLTYAGFRSPRAAEVFFASKLLLGLTLSGLALAVSAFQTTPVPRIELIATVLAAIGFYWPNVWLSGRVQTRQGDISRALPDTLDLLTTCVEAGLGLEAALHRIAKETRLSAPVLAGELEQTLLELGAGMPRAEAFRRLAQRTGVDELKNLAAVLIQTEMFGTSIARALRVHSSSMRVRRTHRAEEKAATVAVKMLLPLILFILPSLFVVILGPAVIRIIKILIPALVGGK